MIIAALADGMKQGIWFDKAEIELAEYNYQMFLAHGKSWQNGMGQNQSGSGNKVSHLKLIRFFLPYRYTYCLFYFAF